MARNTPRCITARRSIRRKAFRARNWQGAHNAFEEYLSIHKRDGPARFYLRLCALSASSPERLGAHHHLARKMIPGVLDTLTISAARKGPDRPACDSDTRPSGGEGLSRGR